MGNEEDTANSPLAGMKVIELAHVMAGPTTGRILADLGADVIKLERPDGEDCRRMAPPWQGDEAAGFLMLNRNKRGISVNLKHEKGRQVLLELIKDADVIIENFRKGTMEKLGIGYETLSELNPGLIYCEISGYGRTGPYADRAGFDLVAQAISGVMSVTGEGPGRPPVKSGVPVGDISAGLLAVIGVLAAYAQRSRTGRGQRVDTSLFEACASYMVWPSATYFATGEIAEPVGTAHPLDAPYQAFEASDGWFIVGAANQSNWVRLVDGIGASYLKADPRFLDNPARVGNLKELDAELSAIFQKESKEHWMCILNEVGVPTGPINDVEDLLQHPQMLARDMIVDVEHKSLGTVKTLGLPIRFSEGSTKIKRGAPLLGEHTHEVLAALGYSAEERAQLFECGAVS